MNEFKGTQSDWKIAGQDDNGIFIGGDTRQDAIAIVYYNNNTVKIGEGKANARLIANAKRLMEALLIITDNIPEDVIRDQVGEDAELIFSAINDAMGWSINTVNNEEV